MTYSKDGVVISQPAAYLATQGDVITVLAINRIGCSSEVNFSIQVNDRQKFGVCAPLNGKVYEVIGSELTMLQQSFDPQHPVISNEVFFTKGDKVLIENHILRGSTKQCSSGR